MFEAMPSALITVDSELNIKLINTNALRIAESTGDEVLDEPIFAAFPILEPYQSEIQVALSQNATVTLDQVEYVNEELNNYYKACCYPLNAIDKVIVNQIHDTMQRVLLEQRILQTEKMRSLNGLAAE